MKGPTQQRSQETHRQIVEAAQNLFAQFGYDATSVTQICQAAGVSKGAFYYHFPSKQSVFLELLENWLNTIDFILNQSRGEMTDVPQGLVSMAEKTREVFQVADGRLPMFLEFWSRARLDPAVWQGTIAPYRRYQSYFASMIEDGVSEGTIKQVEPELAARVIVSMAVGLLLQSVLDPQGEDWGRVASEGVRLLLDGLARRNA
jgi:AcrR family transcriptional regulator